MKLSKLAEIGATLGAATLVGLNVLQHKEEKPKKLLFRHDHIALYSSLIATGLALWEIRKHHRAAA